MTNLIVSAGVRGDDGDEGGDEGGEGEDEDREEFKDFIDLNEMSKEQQRRFLSGIVCSAAVALSSHHVICSIRSCQPSVMFFSCGCLFFFCFFPSWPEDERWKLAFWLILALLTICV